MAGVIDGGFQAGSVVLVYGATGAGKTQLGHSFLNPGLHEEGRRGCLVDFATRGDSQQHSQYARRLFGWNLTEGAIDKHALWESLQNLLAKLNGLEHSGRRVIREDVTEEEWETWRSIFLRRLDEVTAFLYAHFSAGKRRLVID